MAKEKKEKRFIVTQTQSGGFTSPGLYVLVDKETGVNYVYAAGGYGGGITPLLDTNGKPIVTPLRELESKD